MFNNILLNYMHLKNYVYTQKANVGREYWHSHLWLLDIRWKTPFKKNLVWQRLKV